MPIGQFNAGQSTGVQSERFKGSGTAQKSTPIQWKITAPRHSFDDLILSEDTVSVLMDVVSYYQNLDKLFHDWGLSERYTQKAGLSVNLYGPAGTGKTLAAHAIAKALGFPMICVDYADIESKYVGETSKNLSSLFKTATEEHALIFFDEADAILSKRVTNMTSATDVSVNQTRSVLLTLLNDYQGVVIFATNFIRNFDAAFLRRIQYHIQFHLPSQELRERLWRTYIPAIMPCQVDCLELAKMFPNVSGSDISNAVFTAAVSAARNGESMVAQHYFEDAIKRAVEVKVENEEPGVSITTQEIDAEEAKRHLGIMEEQA